MEREPRFAAAKVASQRQTPPSLQWTRSLCFQAFWFAAAKGVFAAVNCFAVVFGFAIITVYVDDLNLIGTPKEFTRTTKYLKKEFEIRKLLLTAQSRQKSYANRRRRPLEFEVTSS